MKKTYKKIVIIGAGNIGLSIIKNLDKIDDYIEIIVISRSLSQYLKEYLDSSRSNNIKFIQADVTNENDIKRIEKDENLQEINVIVSTVGILSKANEFDEYKKGFNANFYGNVLPIKALLDKIPKNADNRIILISSTSGNKAPKFANSYASSKWALESFAGSLQHELVKDGIYVDIIRPTNIINEYSKSFTFNKGIKAENVAQKIVKQIQYSIKGKSKQGRKIFIPKYFLGVRFLERVFPGILNYISSMKPAFIRKKIYRQYTINKVLITGGSSGLGRELAFNYCNSVKEIILTGRNIDKLVETKNAINQTSNCNIEIKQIDFESTLDIKKFVKEIHDIDLLINNAGQHIKGLIQETSIKDYIKIFDSNFFSAVLLTQALVKRKNIFKVINILSSTAICGRKNISAYSASKSALWAYTRSMRRQYGNSIQFLEVIPSTFKSDLFRNSSFDQIGKIEPKIVAHKIYEAEKSGNDIVYFPYKVRLFLLLESVLYFIFKRKFLS